MARIKPRPGQFQLDFDTVLPNENFEDIKKDNLIVGSASNVLVEKNDELYQNLTEFTVIDEVIVESVIISEKVMASGETEDNISEQQIQTLLEQYNTIDKQLNMFDMGRLDTIHVSLRTINTHPRGILQIADIQDFGKVINTRNLGYTYQKFFLGNDSTLSILLSQCNGKIMTKERFYELCKLVADTLLIGKSIDVIVNEALFRYLNPLEKGDQYGDYEDSVQALPRILQGVRYILGSSCIKFPVEQYGDEMVCLMADSEKAGFFVPLHGKKDKPEGRDRISLLVEL